MLSNRLELSNSRVPRWGHDQNATKLPLATTSTIAECPDGGTIKTEQQRVYDMIFK